MSGAKSLITGNLYNYKLALADGQKWIIVPSKKALPWVKKLARLMLLKRASRNAIGSRLIICRRVKWRDNSKYCLENLDGIMINRLPIEGWVKEPFYTTIQEWFHPDASDVISEIGEEKDHESEYAKMCHFLYIIYKRVLDKGGFSCHAALVEHKKRGYLLVGPGGIGKTTCYRRFRPPWIPLCDDEALVVRNSQGKYRVHPFPTWSDYICRRSQPRWDVQYNLPVGGIFFLRQAHNDKIFPIGQGQAAVSVNEEAMRIFSLGWARRYDAEKVRTLRKKLFTNTSQFSLQVPAFILEASRSGKFWEEMEKALDGQE